MEISAAVYQVFAWNADNKNSVTQGIYSDEKKAIEACLDETYGYCKLIQDILAENQDIKWLYPKLRKEDKEEKKKIVYLVYVWDPDDDESELQGVYLTLQQAWDSCLDETYCYCKFAVGTPVDEQDVQWITPGRLD